MIADEDAYNYLIENDVDLFAEKEAFDGKHGIMAYNRTLQRPGKATQEKPINEWIVSVGKHLGAIPGSTWVQVQKLLELNKSKSYRKPRSHVALLSGLLYCGKCGSYMRPKLSDRKTATGEALYTYLCTTRERSQGHVCDMKNANGNTLDAKVIETIKSFGKQNADMAKQITQTKKRISGNREGYEEELGKLRLQMEDNEKDIKGLVISLGKTEGRNAEKYIIEQIDVMHEKGEALRKRLSELEAIIQQHDLADIEFDIIRQMLSNMGESIDYYTVEQKRAAIRTFIRKIVWDGENAHLYLFHNDEEYEFPALSDGNDGNNSDFNKNLDGISEDSYVPLGEDSE
jgi:hypothetical protein